MIILSSSLVFDNFKAESSLTISEMLSVQQIVLLIFLLLVEITAQNPCRKKNGVTFEQLTYIGEQRNRTKIHCFYCCYERNIVLTEKLVKSAYEEFTVDIEESTSVSDVNNTIELKYCSLSSNLTTKRIIEILELSIVRVTLNFNDIGMPFDTPYVVGLDDVTAISLISTNNVSLDTFYAVPQLKSAYIRCSMLKYGTMSTNFSQLTHLQIEMNEYSNQKAGILKQCYLIIIK